MSVRTGVQTCGDESIATFIGTRLGLPTVPTKVRIGEGHRLLI